MRLTLEHAYRLFALFLTLRERSKNSASEKTHCTSEDMFFCVHEVGVAWVFRSDSSQARRGASQSEGEKADEC